jgi:multisubunit Na+/H+ antiporter MnhB subunit
MEAIKNENLQEYFNQESRPEYDQLRPLSLLLFIIGFIVIIAGVIRLINGSFSIGISYLYQVPVIHGGGQIINLGLVLFIGGLTRYKFESRKNKFVRELIKKGK